MTEKPRFQRSWQETARPFRGKAGAQANGDLNTVSTHERQTLTPNSLSSVQDLDLTTNTVSPIVITLTACKYLFMIAIICNYKLERS